VPHTVTCTDALGACLLHTVPACVLQVDERLQTVLCGVPPPAELPWETARPTDTEQSHSHSHSHSHQQPHKPSGS